jgi:hypothetical protein
MSSSTMRLRVTVKEISHPVSDADFTCPMF